MWMLAILWSFWRERNNIIFYNCMEPFYVVYRRVHDSCLGWLPFVKSLLIVSLWN